MSRPATVGQLPRPGVSQVWIKLAQDRSALLRRPPHLGLTDERSEKMQRSGPPDKGLRREQLNAENDG